MDDGNIGAAREAPPDGELERSLLQATLESTADGILVVDHGGRVVATNQAFSRLWRIPAERLASGDDQELLGSVLGQLADPAAFLAKVEHLYQQPDASSFDVIELRDGRTFERWSQPQRVRGESVGRVWSFRDVTERRRAQEALRESEARARAFFEEADVGMAEFDLQGRWIRVNRKLCQMLGRTEAEMLALSFEDVTHADDMAQGHAVQRQLAAGGPGAVQEKRYLRKDGSALWVQVSSTLVRDGEGQPLREIAVIDDLRSANLFLASVLENIPAAVYVKDAAELRYLRVNRGFEELAGRPRAEILGLRATDVFPGRAAVFEAQDRQALESGVIEDLPDEPLQTPQGERWLHTRKLGLRDEQGTPRFLLGISQDVTERRRAAEARARFTEELERRVEERTAALRRANAELEREIAERKHAEAESRALQAQLLQADRMASLGTLAAGVAHEINNPLAFVMANLELVAESLAGPAALGRGEVAELAEVVREARQGTERIRKTVRELRTFSRGGEERRAIIALAPVVQLAVAMTRNQVRHRARLETELGPSPLVEADEGRLVQVLMHLLLNAAQAIPEGRAEENRVRVATRTGEGGSAVIEVSDTGAGIAPEHLGRVFDPFFTTKDVGEGTGLGLAVCHGIVTAHGGAIAVESTPGRGSTFRVVLPPAPARAGAAEPARPAAAPPARRARVLVIDDEPLVGSAVRRTLREHEVVLAGSGAEALALLARDRAFDVIFCDLMMPEMPGERFHQLLGHDFPALLPRLVFITGGAFTAAARDFLERTGAPRLEKPFETGALEAAIRRLAYS